MSTFATNTTAVPALSNLFTPVFSAIEAAVQYRAYRKTVSELNNLSSKELDDLGLNRSAIKSVAMEAVYGA
ncbi:DUF1127 domain-containing protein [Amylibacter sp. IMCC11727]|uniref:DUF1127 domain-containing protein n=1 Tax=Amylibacter sp. IMCC11727 TaxID=3039851 RepID=UPI00244E379E|nr:DUF1127 domain-containing protein [Amylibacter sp. IMCC11727]WGI22968.1 DUF1127 domain-containing protein [Amylibacter sp. IMCC11727]